MSRYSGWRFLSVMIASCAWLTPGFAAGQVVECWQATTNSCAQLVSPFAGCDAGRCERHVLTEYSGHWFFLCTREFQKIVDDCLQKRTCPIPRIMH